MPEVQEPEDGEVVEEMTDDELEKAIEEAVDATETDSEEVMGFAPRDS